MINRKIMVRNIIMARKIIVTKFALIAMLFLLSACSSDKSNREVEIIETNGVVGIVEEETIDDTIILGNWHTSILYDLPAYAEDIGKIGISTSLEISENGTSTYHLSDEGNDFMPGVWEKVGNGRYILSYDNGKDKMKTEFDAKIRKSGDMVLCDKNTLLAILAPTK